MNPDGWNRISGRRGRRSASAGFRRFRMVRKKRAQKKPSLPDRGTCARKTAVPRALRPRASVPRSSVRSYAAYHCSMILVSFHVCGNSFAPVLRQPTVYHMPQDVATFSPRIHKLSIRRTDCATLRNPFLPPPERFRGKKRNRPFRFLPFILYYSIIRLPVPAAPPPESYPPPVPRLPRHAVRPPRKQLCSDHRPGSAARPAWSVPRCGSDPPASG